MIVEQSNLSTINNDVLTQDIKIKKGLINRKTRNMISGIIKRCIDLVAGIVGTILLIPITLFVFISNKYYL